MKQQVLQHFEMPWLTCVGLLVFVAVFLGAVAWVTRRGGTEFYRALGRLPFEGDHADQIGGAKR